MRRKASGDRARFNAAWETMEKFMIPTHADQPTNSFYNAAKPATYAPDADARDPRIYGRVYMSTNGRGIVYGDGNSLG